MIDRKFGPEPEEFDTILNAVQSVPALAQSIYDVQTSRMFGTRGLTEDVDTTDLYEICTAQHIYWDHEQKAVRGLGFSMTDDSRIVEKIGLLYRLNHRAHISVVNKKEANSMIEKAARALKLGGIATFAAWEYVRTSKNPTGAARLNYARFDFSDIENLKVIQDKTVDEIPEHFLDASFNLALWASALAHENSH